MTDQAQAETHASDQAQQPPTLQDAIDRAGSPMQLLWAANPPTWAPPGIPPEHTGWRGEATAGFETVALLDLSQHMPQFTYEGKDTLRFFSDFLINDLTAFAVNQAKQVVGVDDRGYVIGDGILTRDAEARFTLTGVRYLEDWLNYQASIGGYDMSITFQPDAGIRGADVDPTLFRYQVMGPNATELIENMFGGPLPKTKFFHLSDVELDGRRFRALRHGMLGQPGYEFIGDWADQQYVLDAIMRHGEPLGIKRVGAMAYSLSGLESGWIPIPIAAIFDSAELESYRRSISLYSFEGMYRIGGSFYSTDIRDYYVTPFDLGYGKLIDFEHDFYGKAALEKLKDTPSRQRVTLVLDAEQVKQVWGGPDLPFEQSYSHNRIEADGELVGLGVYTGSIPHAGTMLVLALIDQSHAAPGTKVTYVWGAHPGKDAAPDAEASFARIDAEVQPSPFNSYARSGYRAD